MPVMSSSTQNGIEPLSLSAKRWPAVIDGKVQASIPAIELPRLLRHGAVFQNFVFNAKRNCGRQG